MRMLWDTANSQKEGLQARQHCAKFVGCRNNAAMLGARSVFPHNQGVVHRWLGVARSATGTGSGTSSFACSPACSRRSGSICCASGQQGRALEAQHRALNSKQIRQACATDGLRTPGTWGTSSSATRRPPTMRAPSTTAGRAGMPRACSLRPARPRTSACH